MILEESSRFKQGFNETECEPRHHQKGILRPKLMSAADYVFYLRRHLAAERRKNDLNVGFPGDENLSVGIPRLSFLLRRLEEDMQSSYLSFLEEFSSDVHDGIGCLLNLLKTCHGRQKGTAMFPYATCSRGRPNLVNKGTIDEFYCLLCLKAASRSSLAIEKMVDHKTGMSSIAACIMSAHMRSRIIAIELMTTACKYPEKGVLKVQEAMTAVRVVFGESVKFKFLITMLHNNVGLNCGFEATTMAFLNTLLDQTPKLADRVRIQSELEEAGFNLPSLEKELRQKYGATNYRLWSEIDKWRELQVDLQNVMQKHHENMKLRKEVHLLRSALKRLQEERAGILTIHKELRGQWFGMEQRIKALALKTRAIHSSTDEEGDSGGDSIPTSESSTFEGRFTNKITPRIPTESHDSELEEILIDIPTIQPGSLFDVRRDPTRIDDRATRKNFITISDTPPPLPPNHPKLSDSGISSAHDSDPDFNVEWHYPDVREPRVEKRSSSAKVRFSESATPKSPTPTYAKDSNNLPTVVLPPGKNKTKYADIMGIENANARNEGPVHATKKLFNSGFGKNKNKEAKATATLKNTTSGKKFGGKKLWGCNKSKNEAKNPTHLGSSLNGMIHREIAKAMRERKELFES